MDACISCLAPYTLACSVLLFLMAHLLTSGSWTFEVLAAKHEWNVAEKSRCCRNAAIFYLLFGLGASVYTLFRSRVERCWDLLLTRITGRSSVARAALLERTELGAPSRRRGGRVRRARLSDEDEEDEEGDFYGSRGGVYGVVGGSGGSAAMASRDAQVLHEMTTPAALSASPLTRFGRSGQDALGLFRSGADRPKAGKPKSGGVAGRRVHGGYRNRGYAFGDSNDDDEEEDTAEGGRMGLQGGPTNPNLGSIAILSGSPRSMGDQAGLASREPYESDFGSDVDYATVMRQQSVLRQRAFARVHPRESSDDARRMSMNTNMSSPVVSPSAARVAAPGTRGKAGEAGGYTSAGGSSSHNTGTASGNGAALPFHQSSQRVWATQVPPPGAVRPPIAQVQGSPSASYVASPATATAAPARDIMDDLFPQTPTQKTKTG